MEVKNRLGFPPMLTFSSDKTGCPSDVTYTLYGQRARGGVGLITYEAAAVDPEKFAGTAAYIGVDDNIPTFKKFTDFIHGSDVKVKIGIQLVQNGILDLMGKALLGSTGSNFILGPSNINPIQASSAFNILFPTWSDGIKEHNLQIREMNIEEIITFENLFAAAAKRAIQAGFDYVEIHACHGSLASAFLAPYYNKRTDEYGGSLENRNRFVEETVEKIRKEIGEKPPIFVRISADELLDDGIRIEDGKKISQLLEKVGVDCMDISQGNMIRSSYGIIIPTYYDPGAFIPLAEAIKKVVNIPVIGVGRITNPMLADKFIQQGKADIIYMGRQLLCDPDTPNKYFTEQLDDIRYCIGCLQDCYLSAQICALDQFGGRNYKDLVQTTEPRKIIILGAGIAGMEAARVAKLRGHEVSIYEKTDKLGGIMPIVAKEYKKGDFMNIVKYLEIQLDKLKVPIIFNKVLTEDEIAALKPDVLVLACGSSEFLPEKLKDTPNILTQAEAILKTKPMGKNLVIRGLNTFWKGGAETAITLREEGYNIKALVGPGPLVASEILPATGRRLWILEYFQKNNIPIYVKIKNLEVTKGNANFIDEHGKEQSIEFDNFIYCGARRGNNKELKKKFKDIVPKIVSIGDGKRPGDIKAAMKDAATFARKI
ncbi:MAG: FAD-dependent oxidoreductase [Candidatus Helarchaeota archaeon]|nr:FAD-dependent oxidoreductase [Candidatus Helarchaeota archaeon]